MKKKSSRITGVFKNGKWIAPLLLLGGLLIRLLFLARQYAAAFDEVHYLQLAASSVQEGITSGLHIFWPPFFPFIISLFARVIPDFEMAGRIVSISSGFLSALFIYLFCRKYYGLKAARFSLVWSLLLPPIAYMQTAVLTESLYTLLALSGIFAGWIAIEKQKWIPGAAAGMFFAFAYLTRPEGAGFILVYAAITLCAGLFTSFKYKNRKYIVIAVSSVLMFLICSLPYLIFLRAETGRWIPSGKIVIPQGQNYAVIRGEDDIDVYRILPDNNETTLVDKIFHEGAFQSITEQTGQQELGVAFSDFFKKFAKNYSIMAKSAVPSALSLVLFVFICLGLFGAIWNKERLPRELYLFAFLLFFWFLLIPAFEPLERYIMPLVPIGFIWAGPGMQFFSEWVQKTLNNNFSARNDSGIFRHAGCMFVILMFTAGSFVPETARYAFRSKWDPGRWAHPVEQKHAGLWLKENSDSIPKMMSRFHTVNYYAGNFDITQSFDIPLDPIERIYEFARHKDLEYLVINQRYIADNPNMAALLHAEDIPDYLQLVYDETLAPGLKTVVYRFKYENIDD